jgi:hypothetical protein
MLMPRKLSKESMISRPDSRCLMVSLFTGSDPLEFVLKQFSPEFSKQFLFWWLSICHFAFQSSKFIYCLKLPEHLLRMSVPEFTPLSDGAKQSVYISYFIMTWTRGNRLLMDSCFKKKKCSSVDLVFISSNICLKALNPFIENFDSDIARNWLHNVFHLWQ